MRAPNDIERKLFIQYGSAAAEAMFDYPCHFFQIPNFAGFIAYRIEFKCAVIFGDPICSEADFLELTQAFHKYCESSGLNIIYITVSKKFVQQVQSLCHVLIEVCEEIIFDPQLNLMAKSQRLHKRVNKAIKHGLTFHEYIPFNQEIEDSIKEIGIKRQKAIRGPSLYLGHLNFFESSVGKRWFYVKDGDQITSMVMLSQLKAQKGWLLKFLMTVPDAFPETSEFLMTSLLSTLQKEDCHSLTKGMVAVDLLGEVRGVGLCTKLVKGIYRMISSIFKFKKRKEYWQRYCPKTLPSYLLFSQPKIGVNETRALMKVVQRN